MTFLRPANRMTPKVSTMPRQKTESAHYLNAYKLTIEKKRLQQELDSLGKRRDRIQERLDVIEQQIQDLECAAHQYRNPLSAARSFSSQPNSVIYPPAHQHNSVPEDFKTLTLDY